MRFLKAPKLDFTALRDADRLGTPGLEFTRTGRGPWMQWRAPADRLSKRASIPIRHLPPALSGLRILHLSDPHFRTTWGRGYDQIIERVQCDPPDVILITGDFVDCKTDHRPALPLVRRFIGGLVAKHGIFAILGNHDPDVLLPHVADMGVTFIPDRRIVVPIGSAAIELIGMPGVTRHEFDMDFIRAVPAPVKGIPRIVLCHYPDLFAPARHLEPDLYLTGHTHGGQICLPNGWPPITHDRMPRRFCKGIHKIGHTWFAVNAGLGFAGIPLRIFCPAEVIEFVLRCDINAPEPAPRSPDT